MRRRRRENPGVYDLIMLALLGGAGLFLISRFVVKGSALGCDLRKLLGFPCADSPDDRRAKGQPAFKIGSIEWDRAINRGGTMNVRMPVYHWGPADRYWIGAQIDCLGEGERREQFFDVGSDGDWTPYTVSTILQFQTIQLRPGWCDLIFYVADAGNNRLVEQREFGGEFMTGI